MFSSLSMLSHRLSFSDELEITKLFYNRKHVFKNISPTNSCVLIHFIIFLQLGLACMASDCESSFPVSKFLFASSTWTFKFVILHHLDCSHLLHLAIGFYFSKMLKLETLRISFYLILWVEVKIIASVYVWVDRSCGIF